jgi:hypothetical protein
MGISSCGDFYSDVAGGDDITTTSWTATTIPVGSDIVTVSGDTWTVTSAETYTVTGLPLEYSAPPPSLWPWDEDDRVFTMPLKEPPEEVPFIVPDRPEILPEEMDGIFREVPDFI